MKSLILNEKPKEETIDYPCLRKALNGSIYLFLSNKNAIIVWGAVGDRIGHWSSTIDIKNTSHFYGTIQLSN